MSDQGERMCPLCTEEMDLTDQQLKPCKCGYEVCVWCWHHIMEMAEKDETEARCPACRTPYDKEKIVGAAANCERQVAGVGMERKKSQKAKVKTSEGRKQLSSARVIQRNLVYIVGLPLNLADEDLLLRKEYFGQYGKVLKVSVSRTSGGAVQQFPNNTCSVYITYAKEEEAIRCIQSIHGFTLEGRSLRACFGTTKYCHAWLRNAPCTNPDCLYLHDIGSHEDSFTKDEIVSAYSRIHVSELHEKRKRPFGVFEQQRVQQITGITNNVQQRSGNVLPPPIDDYCHNSSVTTAKPILKSTPNNVPNNARISPPTTSVGRNGALPAAASWGTRASDGQSSTGSLVCSNVPAKQKPDAAGAPVAFSAAVAGMKQTSSQCSDKKAMLNDNSHPKELESKRRPPENMKQLAKDLRNNLSDNSDTPLVTHTTPIATGREPSPSLTEANIKSRHSAEKQSNVAGAEKARAFATERKSDKLCPDAAPVTADKQLTAQNSEVATPSGLSLDCFLVTRDEGLQHFDGAKLQEPLALPVVCKDATSTDGASALRSDMQSSAMLNLPPGKEKDFEIQGVSDSIVPETSLPTSAYSFDLLSYIRNSSQQHSDAVGVINHNVNPAVNKQGEQFLAALASHPSVPSNGFGDDRLRRTSGIINSSVLPVGSQGNRMVTSDNGAVNTDLNPGMDVIESSIISNILSLDMDAWDDSLISPQNLVKLLGENERPRGSFNLSSSCKAQSSNQSRFSFARQEESRSHLLNVEPSSNINPVNAHSFSPALVNREPYMDRLRNGFGIPGHNVEQYGGFGSSQSVIPTNKLSASRTQISAPPGFSVPSKSPPPGFSFHGRSDQSSDMRSGNYFLETASRDPYLASPNIGSSSAVDIEFIDPAILAVGKGRPTSSFSNSSIDVRPAFSSQSSAFESDGARLHSLMQRSFQPHQNHRYADIGDNYSPSDAHVFSSRHLESSQIGSLSSFSQFGLQPRSAMSNGLWDKLPEVMAGNNMGMPQLFQNDRVDRLSFNKHYGGYEESKFQMPNSANLYNRTFGM